MTAGGRTGHGIGAEVIQSLRARSEALWPGLQAFRRDLHRHPEPAWTEFRTTGLVARQLESLGFTLFVGSACARPQDIFGAPPIEVVDSYRRAAGALAAGIDQPGVVAILDRGPGPTVALRFDMDALDIAEAGGDDHRPSREGFASRNPDAMHACGHDGHVTIGVGAAELLAGDHSWRGRLKLVFQPAEEGGRGARPMVAAGVADDVDYFAALHLGSDTLRVGEIALEATGFLASVKLDALFEGQAAHAAGAPERGRNALLAACNAALALHGLPRHGQGASFVNAGWLRAGSARNAVASRAELRFEVRGESEAICQDMEEMARRVVEGAAGMQGVAVQLRQVGLAIPGQSDPELTERLAAVVAAHGDLKAIPRHPLGGGDDATFFMRRVQERGGKALYFLLGADARAAYHSSTFDFDERALAHGAALFSGLALSLFADGAAR